MVELRIDPENCNLEVNCSDDPEAPDWKTIITQLTDPRTDIEYAPPYPDPPPVGESNQCLAAANVAEWVWFAGGAFSAELDAGGIFAAFITQVMGIIGGLFTLATDLIIDDTMTLFTEIDHETILDDWNLLDKQEFIDTIVCHINADGTFDISEWGDFLNELVVKSGTNPAWMMVHYVCGLMGYGGVSIAALMGGITTADCAECEEACYTFDFEVSAAGFSGYDPDGNYTPVPLWVSGEGWQTQFVDSGAFDTYRGWIRRAQAFNNITRMKVDFFVDGGSGYIAFRDIAAGTVIADWSGIGTGEQSREYTLGAQTDYTDFGIYASTDVGQSFIYIRKITLWCIED